MDESNSTSKERYSMTVYVVRFYEVHNTSLVVPTVSYRAMITSNGSPYTVYEASDVPTLLGYLKNDVSMSAYSVDVSNPNWTIVNQ